jgi:hypothetical protein
MGGETLEIMFCEVPPFPYLYNTAFMNERVVPTTGESPVWSAS